MTTARPRVLLVTAEYAPTPGGIGDYTSRLAAALAAHGAAPAVLTGPPLSSTSLEPAADQAEDWPVWRTVPGWDWRLWRAVERAAADWRAEIVHLQYQTGAFRLHPAINLLPWWLRRPGHRRPAVVTTFHDTRVPYLWPRAGRVRLLVNRLLARGSDLVIATNPADQVSLATVASRCILIPIGPNIEPTAETEAIAARLRTALHLRSNELLLVTFGLLNHSKGLPTLLRALARLNGESAVGRYRLVLVGAGASGLDPTDRATAQILHQLADELGIATALIWTGQQPAATVAGWLRAADVVALPYVDGASYRRGTLLAALACGAAVVTTTPAAAAIPTTSMAVPPLRTGDQVMFVPAEEPAALATALAAVAGDPWLNRGLRRGAVAVAAHFTWPTIAAQTLTAYQALQDRP